MCPSCGTRRFVIYLATMPATAFGSAAHPCFSRSTSLPRPCHPHHPAQISSSPRNSQQLLPCLQKSSSHATCSLKSLRCPQPELSLPHLPSPSTWWAPTSGHSHRRGESPVYIHGHMPTDTGSLRTETITYSSFTPKPDKSPCPKFMNQPIQRDDWKERKVWKAKGKKHKQRLRASEPSHLRGPRWKVKNGELHFDKALWHLTKYCKLCLYNNKGPM